MDTMKKCPHCGGRARAQSNYSQTANGYFIFIRCTVCGSQGKTCFSYTDPADDEQDNEALSNAISAWNMRYKGE